ncbi:NYN domain-containing protein [Amaricoccus sp.]|uniref:NYN domain-containing protein n=1 Tax=Amaricoccus sp. TaxID=1872485 RepID=UPI001B7B52AE|nr:NYN domain-containing protein [Amaricoccus sp.]MBP7000683.1 NYN domain-containing protein [Amaricoccus sp.]
MTNGRSPRLAVLIDADNTSARVVEGLFLEIAKLGEASVRRIYGDFADARMRGWAEALPRHAIVPQQNFAYTTGKNSADIALVIDAMDLLHSGRFDGFCLVSSDSDFTRLAARVREQGLDAYGFGQKKTPEAFRQACKRFFFTENLMPAPPEGDPAAARKESPAAAVALLTTAVEELEEDDGWVALGALGTQLQKIAPDFDTRTYGSSKLSALIEKTGRFELDRSSQPIRLRLRE